MAEIIPQLNRQTLSQMTSGEKRLARRLADFLEDDYLVWYDIPVGKKRRYPDFIILHPSRGLLFLEVKDWKQETLKKISKTDVTLQTSSGLVTKIHPLEQARQYAYAVLNKLQRDPALLQKQSEHQGNLIMPYGWGVVFTNITRKQIEKSIPQAERDDLLPDHLVIYKDEMQENMDAEEFQTHLWDMFIYNFGTTLSLPQIDRIRWHLFPEIRINQDEQQDLFAMDENDESSPEQALPDIIKIMDIQQEQLARSLGEGHRVIHGVSGSGKTLILCYRCLYLAKTLNKPILVLCFNITLAARLRAFVTNRGIGGQVQIYHFHDWCQQQLKAYHVSLIPSDKPVWEQKVDTVISAVDKGMIPRAQYGALLIDEGHDFDAEWLKLVVSMVDPETNSVMLLYDDAQSIYKSSSGLGFSLSSVGIQATGRTTILRLNYRNTREILQFAYRFASHYLDPHQADDDHIPLVEPEAAGINGPLPVVRQFPSLNDEIAFTARCLQKWHQQGIAWGDIAILYFNHYQGDAIAKAFKNASVPHVLLKTPHDKKNYLQDESHVTLITVHSSKGLEFPRVVILGVGYAQDSEDKIQQSSRLLYVGMTRAQSRLLITISKENALSRSLLQVENELENSESVTISRASTNGPDTGFHEGCENAG